MKSAYLVACTRSAVAKAGKGGFKFLRSDDLAVDVIKHLMTLCPTIDPKDVDDVIVGCANPEGEQGLQIGRMISLRALGQDVPGFVINRYCASGLEAIAIAHAKISAGMGDIYVAGGTESMSMIPMTGYKFAPSYQVASTVPNYVAGMGHTAEAVAKKYNISREAQDEFSVNSHKKAANAIKNGYFKDQIVPIQVRNVFIEDDVKKELITTIETDEGVRLDTTLEGLAKLKPAFTLGGSVTAGNSSQTSDGASFVLVVSEDIVKRHNLKPIARLLSCNVAGVDPLYMGMGPCAAIPKALKYAGLNLDQIQMIELNEAFAAQSLAVIQEGGLNPDIINPNGGAIALGHPLGCSGAKLTTQLLYEMRRQDLKYGMVTACVGGGQGIAGIFELL
ncbi:MAG: acetyl-CoA C-acyltransferase [Saprospiraceae bacterium]|jgi:acetyl-CoA acyltransferase|nr:acetyl-CoA C-acyltransferase [Saprospiraceae bacterium]